MANVAHDPPVDDIVTPEAVIEPPYVECKPLPEPEDVEVIFVPVIVTTPLLVAQTAFAPFAAVVISPSVIVTPPP